MKHLWKFTFGALALALASCSSEAPAPNNGNDADGDVYAALRIKLPTGTRAGNAGQEYGQDSENYVSKILVVLTTKNTSGDYIFLTYDEADAMGGDQIPGDHETTDGQTPVNELKYTLNFSAKDMNPSALDVAGSNEGADIYVFAFCNPTTRLRTIVSNWIPGVTSFNGNSFGVVGGGNSIWNANNFLMTNCHIPDAVTLPSRSSLVQNHNTPEKALNLGTVHVKRLAARFDFALGGENADNKYEIKNTSGDGTMGTVELTDIAMFNIAKNFYYLPRSNDRWDWTGNTTLCGDLESYVMSYNANGFKQQSLANGEYKKYYFANLIGNTFATGETEDPGTAQPDGGGSTKLTWTSIRPADWNSKTQDNNDGWTQDPKNDYRIWRYATENTIPASSGESITAGQKVGITTGVVFKGTFTPTNAELWNGNVIYLYNGIVYGDYAALKAYVTKYPESVVASAFNAVPALKDATGTDYKVNLLAGMTSAQRHGFKAYVPDAGKNTYTMYYFYYNRHNTNGNNSQMGENEFGVVRNNVYKLQVTACGSLGEPQSPENPDTPDEEEKAYFTVSCHVMPWTARWSTSRLQAYTVQAIANTPPATTARVTSYGQVRTTARPRLIPRTSTMPLTAARQEVSIPATSRRTSC